jgi:hypothetical protein
MTTFRTKLAASTANGTQWIIVHHGVPGGRGLGVRTVRAATPTAYTSIERRSIG